MQRKIYALVIGTALAGAAALAACSGGGGSSPSPLAATANQSQGSGNTSPASTGNTTLTISINRNPQSTKRPLPASAHTQRRGAAASRRPQYISQAAKGLQVSVSAAGGTKTVYADINTNPISSLCTLNATTNVQTCTLTVPSLAASETITATEVDQLPTGEVNGYGTGFPTNSHVLAVGTTSASIAGSASITLGLGPVIAGSFDTGCVFFYPSGAGNSNYTDDFDFTNNPGRFVVTAGVQQTMLDCIFWLDAAGSNGDGNATPVPLSDVNGSPEPYTITSSSQHVSLMFYTPAEFNTAFPPATPPPSNTVARAADTSFNFGDCFIYGIAFDGQQPAMSTVVESNNLSATFSPYVTATPYASSETVAVATLTVSPATASVSLGGTDTTTITATDYLGTGGLTAYGSVNNAIGKQNQGECISTSDGVTPLGSVVSLGSISSSTWQQAFQVTGGSTGSCSFVLLDNNTASDGEADMGVITPVVTITITP